MPRRQPDPRRDAPPADRRMGTGTSSSSVASVTAADLATLGRQLYAVDLTAIAEPSADLTSRCANLGITFSDRRAIKVLKLVAASACCAVEQGVAVGLLGAPICLGPRRADRPAGRVGQRHSEAAPKRAASPRSPRRRNAWTVRTWPANWKRSRRNFAPTSTV